MSDSTEATSPAAEERIRYRFVRDDGSRAAAINEMFNRFTRRSRTLEAYHWEWFGFAAGPGFVWAILDPEDRVVGHHGIVRTPLVVNGAEIPAGRTENTIIEADVRKKIFYPGMEKKAFNEVTKELGVLYTVHASGPQARIRERLGYKPVGRWLVYLPVVRTAYLEPLVRRLRDRFAGSVPNAIVRMAASAGAGVVALGSLLSSRRIPWSVTEIVDFDAFESEYRAFWAEARGRYDVTIDRSWEFVRWRAIDNPNLKFRVWAYRGAGRLEGVVIAHEHRLGDASSLYVDDLLTRDYRAESFRNLLKSIPSLDPKAAAAVVMTLDCDTPLLQALRLEYPVQSAALRYAAPRVFDEIVAYDRDGTIAGRRWYATPIFTEGLDTSR